ncbi:ankyrin repeat and SOCS box protein 17-like [Hemiscyllium ocellatum]|uniref:ankyrin repeat and SOCS box protein 17-like n=1 Tax=Hemiscyllium ocellatum TaxID=170820 RepID=UPI0029670009|nr:ankyrin repeat and SOCS box protein 17-like [Hemiscyllium ocellatum]
MSDDAERCCKELEVQQTVFGELLEKVAVKRLLGPIYHNWEPLVYHTLSNILRHIDAPGFDSLLSDYIAFVHQPQDKRTLSFYLEFTEVCINTILYWLFTRKVSSLLVQKLLEKTVNYLGARGNQLGLIWRTFTPVYNPNPLSGVTPLHFVAQNRQSDILKILFQYGILEREESPMSTILIILFYPTSVGRVHDLESTKLIEEAKLCLSLCVRVMYHINVAQIKAYISFRRQLLISNWLDYIPVTRYQEPCELLHLCRMSIRSSLLANSGLPKGISLLPLPKLLQNYLNLER